MILLVLIALAARVDASPPDDARTATSDAFAEAIRYANILTGNDPDELAASDLDEDDGDGDGDDDCDGGDGDGDGDDDDGCAADGSDRERSIDADRTADGRDEDREDDGGITRELAVGDDADPDPGASVDDLSSDLAGAALAGHVAGELAMLDAGAADAGAVAGDDVSFAATAAGAVETYESWMRHQRPSAWGRLDVGLTWRRRWSEPMSGMSRRYDEVWLVATWRR